jgi:hypothetical protein
MTLMISPLWRVFLIGAIGWANVAHAEKDAGPVRDDAGMFHADAIARAERGIADMRRTFDRDLFVQTVASASPQPRRWFPFLRTPQVNRLLEEQARQYADKWGRPGIYVVVCRHPRDVHVLVRPDDDPLFTRYDAEALRRTLARRLSDDDGDAGLLAAVDQVRTTLHQNEMHGASPAANEVFLAAALGGGLLLWLLLGILRWKTMEPDTATQTRAASALLGSMFGCPSGLWVYDKLYPFSPTPCEPLSQPTPEEKENKTDESSSPLSEHAEDMPVSP